MHIVDNSDSTLRQRLKCLEVPKTRLTDLSVKALRPPTTGQETYWCDQLPAFGVRVSQGGSKTFIIKKDNRRRTIGRYPGTTLQEARGEARRLLLQPIPGPTITFTELVELFFSVRCTPKSNKPRTIKDYRRLIGRHFSHLGGQQISAIGHGDIASVVDGLATTPIEANHAFIAVKAVLNFAIERRLIASNPCSSALPYKTRTRERVLSDTELAAVWRSADDYPFGVIARLLILTGQRRTEIGSLQWSYIHDGLITLPPAVTKNNIEHTFPLAPMAVEIVDRIPRVSEYLFPSRNSKSTYFSGWNKCKQRLAVSIPHWTLHDLRRTFSTIHARIGTPPHITERLLNHQVGTLTPIAKIYNRYSYMDEMRAAMFNYEQELLRIFSKEKT